MTTESIKIRSVRLTSYHRDHIKTRALEDAFTAKQAALDAEEHALAEEVFRFFTTQQERDAIATLGAKWFDNGMGRAIRIRTGSGFTLELALPGRTPVPQGATPWETEGVRRWTLEPDTDLNTRVEDLAKRREALRSARVAASQKLGALLNSVSSSTALAELWPDGAPYYVPLFTTSPKPEARAVATPIAEINAVLGLPKPTSEPEAA